MRDRKNPGHSTEEKSESPNQTQSEAQLPDWIILKRKIQELEQKLSEDDDSDIDRSG